MKRILTSEEMGRADAYAINEIGIPSEVLMERAALSVVREIDRRGLDTSRMLVLCGPGNNGGDGAAVARMLRETGIRPDVLLLGSTEKRSEQLRLQLKILGHYGINEVVELCGGLYTLIIDAIFGVGLSRDVTGRAAEIIEWANSQDAFRLAVDMPSGINGSGGAILGTAFKADLTVTFAAGKLGHYLYPGREYTGELVISNIGIPVDDKAQGSLFCIESSDIKSLPARDESGNKGTFGKLLVIAGSRDICGAAYLAARAALKCGAGMVKILTHEANRTALCVLVPEALIDTYGEIGNKDQLQVCLDWADGVVIGPGLGTGHSALSLLESFCELNTLPAVMDADALNLLSANPFLWEKISFKCVLTPHVGEMTRLTGFPAAEITKDPVGAAREFAKKHNAVCVLKDAASVTAYPDSECFINTSGCSALASAGSGDVLSGILGAMLVRYRNYDDLPLESIGVYIHGLLGEHAAREMGRSAAVASDLIDALENFDF